MNFETASRKGEPFSELITRAGMVPNVVGRMCTAHLKHNPMEGWRAAHGMRGCSPVAGIRADEPRRVSKMRARQDVDFILPLADAGVTVQDVVAFWKSMPFDLELPVSKVDGQTIGGNCSLCMLKNPQKLLHLIREDPSLADWWIEQETRTGTLFAKDRPNYAALKVIAISPQLFDEVPDSDALPCECTD